MSNNEKFVLFPHMIQLFNENAERFNLPESAAKLGPRPWKYILMYSPEFVEQCPCLHEFSAEAKEQILHRRKHLAQYL